MLIDPGRKETDKKLREMERHLHGIYKQAYKELKEKTSKYFAQFKEEDAKKAKQVLDGSLSADEYREWRERKLMNGRHWNAMKKQAAKDLHNVNKLANAYMNGQLPDIYALNYNISAKDIEDGISRKISFEMVDARTVRNLSLSDGKSFLPYKELDPKKDIPWNMRKINNAMLQGILQGESITKITERFMDVGVANEVSAIRAARTMATTVENQARMDSARNAEKMGVVFGKVWISVGDERTRPWHSQAAIDYAEPIPLDEPFIVGGEEMDAPGDIRASGRNVYNCRCSLGRKVLGFKSVLPKEKQGKIKVSFND